MDFGSAPQLQCFEALRGQASDPKENVSTRGLSDKAALLPMQLTLPVKLTGQPYLSQVLLSSQTAQIQRASLQSGR